MTSGSNNKLKQIVRLNMMSGKMFLKTSIYFTAIITVAIWALLIWAYYHEGVPSHHILQRNDLPEISNWWGGVTIPLLTWFLVYRMQKRVSIDEQKNAHEGTESVNILYRFIGALAFGGLLCVFFVWGVADVPFYMLISLLLLALFLPIYRAECLLGFVLGMTFTFGGVLPIGIGGILIVIGAVIYLFIRPIVVSVVSKFLNLISAGKSV